jgi:hypothetical protein
MRLLPSAKQILLLAILCNSALLAQTNRGQNLNICLTGKYPALCDHSRLTPEQLKLVLEAERRENLMTCMTGKFSALCDHFKLSDAELKAVREAEKQENLQLCLSGRFSSMCNHSLLSPTEAERVRAAEKNENLRVCLDGRFLELCNKDMLTPEQAKSVAAAEAQAGAARSTPRGSRAPNVRSSAGDCKSGHWIESVAGDGKIIKLEDGSMWQVNDVDTITSSLWLPTSEVVVCGTKIINTDDGESVEATPLSVADGRRPSSAKTVYIIQASDNDETFVINGAVFKAKTYCFNMEKGDKVIFVSGSPSGVCTSAELLNIRTEKICRVWCE